ncbi:NAD-dependent 15-hydroxyprostaglandin dehydrogenase [Rhizodiscina lignyota]|uniref:NAD-dependent 15-hydroxyprostaglandin dehydrogenase n=1 Tax=Rhizodiscina lignyota TaxID=1504668 RepID=A0A9P4ID98_9PEZI|nr:NAD-dependent 15-hydroxyprostaglandin dehydrogenase [Rhizodiscina lignyota]
MPFQVEGKTAIVTGAGSGINFAFAKLLLEKNCNVVVADLALRPEAEEHFKKFTKSPRAVFQKTDVTSWAALEAMFDVALKEFGQIDILCAGAGIFEPPMSNFWFPPGGRQSRDDPRGDRYLTMDINTTHPIRATQLAISHFLNPPRGQEKVSRSNPKRVVICGSVAGQVYGIGTPLYFASKHAITGFVRSLGELDDKLGIRVAAVAPGLVRTPLITEHPEKNRMVDFNKDEYITPEEVAQALLRLCIEDDLKGGTMLEVAARGRTRKVEAFNDPGPQGMGHTVSNADVVVQEVYELLGQNGWGESKL